MKPASAIDLAKWRQIAAQPLGMREFIPMLPQELIAMLDELETLRAESHRCVECGTLYDTAEAASRCAGRR